MTRSIFAELLGTAFLLLGVVGSGIMGESLAGGNVGLALLANAIATGCMLYVLITALGPVSGAHFNPAVSVYFWWRGELEQTLLWRYVLAQVIGGVLGVWAAHVIFDLPILQISHTMHRTGVAQWASEILATFGLLFVIIGALRARADCVAQMVALYITGAYWFTASTSFANPAVTLARGLSDTFAGIWPGHIVMFVVAQFVGVALALWALPRLFPSDGD